MAYIDGCVMAVPAKKKDAFLKHAKIAAEAFREMGATEVVECWGHDVPDGKLTSFPMAVKAEPGETVVFSWIAWPSKDVRDAAHRKMADDPRFAQDTNPMPFDGKRMIFGGFETLLKA